MAFLKERIELAAEEAELMAESAFTRFPKYLKWSIALLILGLLPAFLITRYASQKYWENQYDRYLVIAKPAFENPKNLSVGNPLLIDSGRGVYSAMVEISNENFELALQNQPYEFKFYDNTGQFITSVSGNFFILPNQKKYLIVPRLENQTALSRTNFFLTGEQNWRKPLSITTVELISGIPNYYNQQNPLGFVAEGSVTNNSPFEIKEAKLIFLVYDTAGKLAAVNQRSEFALKPYERRSYKQLWPELSGLNANSVKVIVETNPLDPGNLTVPDMPNTPSSDLSRPKTDPYRY